jgi:fumarylpyruvate hydrolase
MTYVVRAPAPVSLAVAGTDDRFPVRRIFCVGRNYAAHAREMGHDPDREPPFFFTKPADAIVASGEELPWPAATRDLHHEIELVVAIGVGGEDLAVQDARSHVWGYTVGLDMTRRDLQAEAKKLGRPWDMAKGFDQSAPMGTVVPASVVPDVDHAGIRLRVNGEVRQDGSIAQMIWRIDEILVHLSRLVRLRQGDLVMTGTPEGVGPVRPGDALVGEIDGVGTLEVRYRSS